MKDFSELLIQDSREKVQIPDPGLTTPNSSLSGAPANLTMAHTEFSFWADGRDCIW